MNVLFLQASGIDESPVLAEVAAVLRRAGHRPSLRIEREERDLWAGARTERADLVVIQASVLARGWALRGAARARAALGVPVALVGTFPTFRAEEACAGDADIAVLGEAEETLVELCDRLARGRDTTDLLGTACRRDGRLVRNPLRPLVHDLDALPLPDRNLYYERYPFLRRFPWKRFLGSRGCPFSCAYCYQPALRRLYESPAGWVRVKSVERVVEEIQRVRAVGPLRHVHFGDDLFASRPEWVERFAEIYPREVGIGFSCNTVPELATERTVRALARAGCRSIGIGVETGVEARRIGEFGRRTSDATTLAAARRIKGAGIRLVTFNLIGSPGEDLAEAWRTVELNHALQADYARVTLAVPVPGTGFMEGVERDGSGARSGKASDFRDLRGGAPAPAFAPGREREFRNLYYLFVWAAACPRLAPWLRLALRWPLGPLGPLANGIRLLKERSVFHLPWIAGFRYFLHVGRPDRRTHNFVALP